MAEISVYVRIQFESAISAKTHAAQLQKSWDLPPFREPDDVTRKKRVVYLFWDVHVDERGVEDHEGLFRALARSVEAPMHGSMYYNGSVEPCFYRVSKEQTKELYCVESDGGARLGEYADESVHELEGEELLDVMVRAEQDGVFGSNVGEDSFIGEDLVQEALSSLLGRSSDRREHAARHNAQALDAEELTKDLVQQLFDDMQTAATRRDLAGAMKHVSPKLSGTVTNLVNGKSIKVPITYDIYCSSLELMFDEDVELELENLECEIDVERADRAVIRATDRGTCRDPLEGGGVRTLTESRYVCEIVDGKLLITELESAELENESTES